MRVVGGNFYHFVFLFFWDGQLWIQFWQNHDHPITSAQAFNNAESIGSQQLAPFTTAEFFDTNAIEQQTVHKIQNQKQNAKFPRIKMDFSLFYRDHHRWIWFMPAIWNILSTMNLGDS